MSKQSDAKEKQGYTMPGPTCSTCKHFNCITIKKTTTWGATYPIDKDLRCAIGGFAVKKSAYCNMWEAF